MSAATFGTAARAVQTTPEMQIFLHDGMDEIWLADWVAFGFREMEAYLRRQAAFETYYRRRHFLRQFSRLAARTCIARTE